MMGSYSAPTSPAARSPTAWDSSSGKHVQGSSSSSGHGSIGGSPLRTAPPAVPAGVTTGTWAAGTVGPEGIMQRSGLPMGFPEALRSHSPLSLNSRMQAHAVLVRDDASCFQSGVKHAGWLWKRFGHGHKTNWKRLWCYLEDDRLCYCQPDKLAGSSIGGSSNGATGSAPFTVTSYTASSTAAGGLSSTVSSAAALAAGHIKYIALDRIPVRPLPHRQHSMEPMRQSHPDVGIAIIDARVLTGQPTDSPKRTVFSLVAGSHTHYLAADTMREAQLWVSAIRETWLHCFSHTTRRTTNGASSVVVSQSLLAQNAQLRESLQELSQKVSQSDYEYWRKWVEEKAKNQVLESKLVNAATYEVQVTTGSVKGAATDARVYLELYGPDFCPATSPTATVGTLAGIDGCGSGGEVRLFDIDSHEKPFQRGALDSFTVVCHNVGHPARLKVWHDNTGRHPDWFLVEIKVRKKGTKDWACFPCSRWLSTQLDDGRICRELVVGASRPLVAYQVVTFTSDIRGAGTDATVHITLHGLLGDGLKQQLVGGPADFERGARNEFWVEDAELGELTAVTIGQDGTGKSPSWHLDHVEVTPLPYHPSNSSCNGGSSASPTGSTSGTPLTLTMTRGSQMSSSLCMQSIAHGSAAVALQASGSLRAGQRGNAGIASSIGKESVTYLFPCGAWLDERLGDGKTERRLQAASALGSKVAYTLQISTSDVRGAGTDADVHVALIGADGSSETVQLQSKPEHFERGCRDTFRLQLPSVGRLQKLLIGHNGRGDNPSWHLALVEVVEEDTGRVNYFAADRWLGAASSDGLSEITLTASAADPRKALVDYQVCFCTSQLRGSGTDSTVGFELSGERGSSGPITVACGKEAFERGGTDVFSYARPWLGQLQRLVLWHNNSGAAAGRGPWHLEAVEVSCSKDQQVITFPCGRWLSAETQLKVELQPGHAAGITRYRFDVVTSNVRGAGTDGALFIELTGTGPTGAAVSAGPWCLDRSGAFARGSTDTFIVEGTEVATPRTLQVTLQGASLNPDWHLNHVACTLLDGQDDAEGTKYYFSGERWFDSAHGFTATLPCSAKPPGRPDDGQLPYLIRVFTSGVKGAGTDANISLNLMGLKGSSGWQQLHARQEAFERGKEDSFTLKLPDVGPLTHLAVKSDGSGDGPAWHLDKICILPPATGSASHAGPGRPSTAAASRLVSRAASFSANVLHASGTAAVAAAEKGGSHAADGANSNSGLLLHAANQLAPVAGGGVNGASGFGHNGQPVWFVARRWLDAKHGLEVLLEAQGADPAKSLVTYELDVYTSDLKNAGTDARVMIQLVGDRGSSAALELQDRITPTDCFLRGGTDAFSLQLPWLGQLSKICVWLEGPGSPWHLKLIVVGGPDGAVTYFPCGAWLRIAGAAGSPAAVHGSSAQPLELLATSQDPRQYLREYKVVTRTSDVRGAATDAAVFVELIGAGGASSGRQPLAPSGPQAFELGSIDEFKLLCEGLGELVQLRVGHDGSGAHPAWHLLQIEVLDVAAGRLWFFEADCWLDAAQGDGKTERLLLASVTDPLADRRAYRVTVNTSKRKGAGTDGSVFVTLHGSKGPAVTSATTNSSSSSGLLSARQQSQSPAALPVKPKAPDSPAGTSAAASGWLSSGRHGLRGSSRAAFEEGGVGSFMLPSMRSLGQLRQLTLELEGTTSGEGCAWHCQHLEVTCSSTNECWLFPCNAWLVTGSSSSSSRTAAAGTPSAAAGPQLLLYLAPSLEGMWHDVQQELEQEQKDEYRVAVYTSDISGAGTDSAVSVTLYGAAGEAGPHKLAAPGRNCFEQGRCDVFDVQTANKLGQLLRLKVVSDGSGLGSAWHLDTIAVTQKSTAVTTWFYAGRWLDTKSGLEAVLEGATTDLRTQLVTYKVTVHTGDAWGAGTDAHVFVDIRGSNGSSGTQELSRSVNGSGNCFERGQADSFQLRLRDLGELAELTVWHDNSGMAAGWNLAYIEMQHVGNGQVWYFPCGQWLDSTQGDQATRRCLKATHNFDPASLQCAYRVAVTTGNVRGAGTDANVFIMIHGSQGDTGRQLLAKTGRNCFERGQRDEFKVSGPDVGEMNHVVVGHDGSGLGPAWHLAELEVQHMGTGQLLKFTANRWLDAKRPGCSLQCELRPDKVHQQQAAAAAAAGGSGQVNWELLVITGKVLGAGTDADVFISLKGSNGTFGPYTLPAGPEAFETGCRDTFKLATPDIGDLQEVVIGHNNMGMGAAWFLQGLELLNLNTGAKYIFKVAAWLDIQNGCCRTLKPLQQNPRPLLADVPTKGASSCSYQLEIQTSDVEGAGTDAAVFVQLVGADGESEAVQLQAGGDTATISTRALFQRGSLDVFILRGLPCLGSLTHLLIGHDGSGTHPAWHLAWVRVVNLASGDRALFTANCWLDSSLASSNNWVQLPAGFDRQAAAAAAVSAPSPAAASPVQQTSGQLGRSGMFGAVSTRDQVSSSTGALKLTKAWLHTSRTGQPGYKVTFTTSNILGAGTAARVFFELIGEHGSSGVVYASSQAGQFARGNQDSFLYPRLPYVGPLYQLRVGCDGTGMFAPWHLRQVEVVHVHTGQRWLFDSHEWIDKKCTWQRVLPATQVPAIGM